MPEYITSNTPGIIPAPFAEREILRRLERLENYELDAKRDILLRLDLLEAQVQQITERLETLGLDVGQLAKIMLEASVPAENITEEQFAADLDRLVGDIFQGAESLPFDEALRRAAQLKPKVH